MTYCWKMLRFSWPGSLEKPSLSHKIYRTYYALKFLRSWEISNVWIEEIFQNWSFIFWCYITQIKSFWPPSSLVMKRHWFAKCLLLMILFKSSFEFTFRSFIFENETSSFLFSNSSPVLGFSNRVRGPKLSVSTRFLHLRTNIGRFHISAFSDYDLSLICTSKCDDIFLQCIAACSDSNCVLDCNRASNVCYDGEFMVEVRILQTIQSPAYRYLDIYVKHVHATRTVSKAVITARTQSVFVM